jgi:hypothetical protein
LCLRAIDRRMRRTHLRDLTNIRPNETSEVSAGSLKYIRTHLPLEVRAREYYNTR